MQMLKPIRIGPVEVVSPVILAPMTAVTDLPFRRVVKRYGAGLTVSEMIASQAMVRETRQSLQKAMWDPAEEPVSMQLAGCEPHVMAEAAKLNEQGVKVPRQAKPRKPVSVPAALKKALTTNKKAAAAFESFPPSHKREYAEWIADAKGEDTRQRRIDTAVQWIAEGKSRNWKYERK